jgi:DNA-binding response OmpR family regulator
MVDDDPAILRLLKDKLDRAGFEVLTATSGQHALDVMDRCGLPHLAIVDIMVPDMDGFEFCRTVQHSTDLPVIMLSAVYEKATVIRAIEHFAENYVTKPFSPRELVAAHSGDFAYTLELVTQVDEHLAVDFAHQQAIGVETSQAMLTFVRNVI